jgi:hypothetical protein
MADYYEQAFAEIVMSLGTTSVRDDRLLDEVVYHNQRMAAYYLPHGPFGWMVAVFIRVFRRGKLFNHAKLMARAALCGYRRSAGGLPINEALNRMLAVAVAKHKDYGVDNILVYGELGVLVRTRDKLSRIKNLKKKDGFVGEKLEETWMDLAIYMVILLMLMRGQFTLPTRS